MDHNVKHAHQVDVVHAIQVIITLNPMEFIHV